MRACSQTKQNGFFLFVGGLGHLFVLVYQHKKVGDVVLVSYGGFFTLGALYSLSEGDGEGE